MKESRNVTTFSILPFVAIVIATFSFLIFKSVPALAVSLDECEKDSGASTSECIDLFSKKINDLGTQKKTLSSQITQFDTQIKLTQLKITDAQTTIDKLEREIGVLGFRIGYVSDSIDQLEDLVKKRIVATYQQSYVSNFELILTSENFSDLLLKLQYLKQVQENDKKILAGLQQTKSNYANQKDEREAKQKAIEDNKQKLLGLKTSLDAQKTEKQAFLTVTKNDESRYQRLLSQAQAERAIVFGGGKDVFIGDVNQGASIGTIASHSTSPGCSSGAHLHFEVHKNGSVQDPNSYLQPTSVQYPNNYNTEIYGTVNPRGDLPWPINSPIQINQGFGVQKNSSFYGPAGHQGIDIDSLSSPTVKTVKSGKLYGGSIQCGGQYPGRLYYAKVEHDDGLVTWYLHMIPN